MPRLWGMRAAREARCTRRFAALSTGLDRVRRSRAPSGLFRED